VGIRTILEVALIKSIQRTPAHPGLPEYGEDDVAQAGVLVLFKIVQYLRCFVAGEDVVGHLVFGVRLRDTD